jgi:hypothetical protein
MPVIRCRTLGSIDLEIEGEPAPPELRWRKHLALLIYLARVLDVVAASILRCSAAP